MTVSRRVFVRAGGLALVSFGLDPLFLARAAYAYHPTVLPPNRSKALVCLFQRGAVDGLNMVIPYGDDLYYRERPRIAVPRDRVVRLNDHFGLHPALEPMKALWDDGALAIVHAVGSPDSTRSHFDAQDYMESGTPGVKSTRDGWVNRHCQHDREHAETPFRAVAMGAQLPRALMGAAPALAIDDLRSFGIGGRRRAGDRLAAAFEALYGAEATGLVASSSEEAFEAVRQLRAANPTQYAPGNGAQYPRGRLGQSLSQIAQLSKADLGLEIAFADVGGWDTHVNQGADQGQLAARFTELGRGLAAFAADLGERMADVVVLTMSEFGRTIAENGNSGTDHGHATAMFVMGGGVRGGRIAGKWPGLAPEHRFEGRDLAVTTDFRDLFGEVLARHLGQRDLAAVFPSHVVATSAFPGVLG